MGILSISICMALRSRFVTLANEILMLLRANKKYSKEVSLYEPIGVDKDGETVSLLDVIEMENKETLETIILKQDIKELYEVFDSCLKDNEKTIIGMRYGLHGGREYTQREIADLMGISRSYVSRLEKKALERLRTELKRNGI
ncbi:MAG: sigma-70 family RNA polymerase sigma factor [Paenibacillaceae bacterium]|nr:sigma-70 family RNA polymerase sigma factor [Paenibacillaceae bacterium]